MIDSGFVFTQISTTNLDLHTKELGSARNPPTRLGLILNFMFFSCSSFSSLCSSRSSYFLLFSGFGSCFFGVVFRDTYIKTRR
ncbi:hypothetical protein LINGRAHAP2_LOCUS27904 [Linum grandiflorum]